MPAKVKKVSYDEFIKLYREYEKEKRELLLQLQRIERALQRLEIIGEIPKD